MEPISNKLILWLRGGGDRDLPPVHLAAQFYLLEKHIKAQNLSDEHKENLKGVIDHIYRSLFFYDRDERYGLLTKPLAPEAYRLSKKNKKSLANFKSRAKRLSKHKEFNYRKTLEDWYALVEKTFMGVNPISHLFDVIVVPNQILNYHMTLIQQPDFMDYNSDIMNPTEGPVNAYEMLFCINTFIDFHNIDLHIQKDPELDSFQIHNNNLVELFGLLFLAFEDTPFNKILDQQTEGCTATQMKLNDQGVVFPVNRLLGMVRYYVEHNQEKFSPSRLNKIYSTMLDLYEFNIDHKTETFIPSLSTESRAIAHAEELSTTKAMIRSYEKIEPIDLVEHFKVAARKNCSAGKAKRLIEEFDSIRAQMPAGMAEHSVFSAQEHEFVRKLRKSIFKAREMPCGDEGPKIKFIKSTAEKYAAELKTVGFSDDDIAYMRETGKFPKSCTDYTVEHIIDRDIGGTNTPSNFIIMPEAYNKLKDRLKALQIAAYGPDSNQKWFLTWVPDGYLDGDHAPVLLR